MSGGPARRFFRFFLRWTLRLFALLVVLLVGAYLLRDRLLAEPLARFAAEQMSKQLGGRFTLDRISGTWFTTLELHGLRTVEPPPEGPLVRIDLDRAEARFDLFDLALELVAVEEVVVELDLDRPAPPPEPTDPFDLASLPAFPAVELTGSVRVRVAERDIVVDRVRVEGDGRRFTLDTEGLDLAGEVTAERFGGVIERTAPDTLVWTSEQELEGVVPQRAQVVLAGSVDVEATVALAGGALTASYRDEEVVVRAEKLTSTLLPAPLQRLLDEAHPEVVVDSVHAQLTPAGATVHDLHARFLDGDIRARDIRIDFEHPLFVTYIEALEVDVPEHGDIPRIRAVASLPESRLLDLKTITLTRGPSSIVATGVATIAAQPEDWATTTLDLSVNATLDARSLPPDLGRKIEGVVSVAGKVQGSVLAPTGRLTVEGAALAVDDIPIETLRVVGDLQWPRVALESMRVQAAPGTVELKGVADLEAQTLKQGAYEIAITDLAAFGRLIPGAPPLRGAVAGSGAVDFDGVPSGRIELTGEKLEIDGQPIDTLRVEAILKDDTVTVPALVARAPDWSVDGALEANWRARTAQVTRLQAGAGDYEAALNAPLSLALLANGIRFDGLDARVLEGRVTGSGSMRDTIELTLQADELVLPEGKVSATVTASGSPADPRFKVVAKAPTLRFREREASVFATIEQVADGLRIEELRIDGGPDLQFSATGHWPLFVHEGGLRGTDRKPELTVRAHAVFDKLAPDLPPGVGFDRLDLAVDVADRDVTATCTIQELRWTSDTTVRLPGETSLLVNGDAEKLVATLRTPDIGPIRTDARLASPVGIDWGNVAEMRDKLLASNIEGKLGLTLDDLTPLAKLEASPLADIRGSARVTVNLSGTVQAPVVEGLAELDCPQLRLKGDVPSFQETKARIVFDRTRATIEKFDARLGYAPIGIRGQIDYGGTPTTDVKIVGKNVLLARTPHLRLRSDLDIAITGAIDALQVAGTVTVTDALYTQPIKIISQRGASADSAIQLFSIRDGPLSTMRLDLQVDADDTIRVDTNVVQGVIQADLRIRGTGAVPEQVGRLDFRDLLFTFPITRERLRIDQGSVVFSEEDPFRPSLRIRGEKRKLGHDLTVEVIGKIDTAEVFITSVPALPRDEALLLLTAGTLKENMGQNLAMSAGMFAGRSALERLLGPSDPDEESFIERFEVDTGRERSNTGDPTIEASFRVSDNERWYAIAERDRWGDYNGGVMLRFRFR